MSKFYISAMCRGCGNRASFALRSPALSIDDAQFEADTTTIGRECECSECGVSDWSHLEARSVSPYPPTEEVYEASTEGEG